jgi:ElaB/YqjD/DUF883 family membrane-anchored ribosome-binding protein
MASEKESERDAEESMSSVAKAAKKADQALRDTAQGYLNRSGIGLDLRQVEKSIRDKPLSASAIAAAAGFILGGGMAIRPAAAILVLLGRQAAKETATNLVTGVMRGQPR